MTKSMSLTLPLVLDPWTVSVTRTSEDPDSVTDANDLFFKAIVGVLEESFEYPGTALVGLTFPSETFSSVPSVSVDLRGLKIKVPKNRTENLNGDVSYSGTWNGEFDSDPKYCTNPAWIFYDLLTTNRYGCGVMTNNSSDEVDLGFEKRILTSTPYLKLGNTAMNWLMMVGVEKSVVSLLTATSTTGERLIKY